MCDCRDPAQIRTKIEISLLVFYWFFPETRVRWVLPTKTEVFLLVLYWIFPETGNHRDFSPTRLRTHDSRKILTKFRVLLLVLHSDFPELWNFHEPVFYSEILQRRGRTEARGTPPTVATERVRQRIGERSIRAQRGRTRGAMRARGRARAAPGGARIKEAETTAKETRKPQRMRNDTGLANGTRRRGRACGRTGSERAREGRAA